tara:strand:- start:56 stop:466 length:411 start_codon:yes stop_codon:yes gene_type:complete
MRATISFEADVTRVNDIMRSLVLEESNALQEALMSLEKATSDRIVDGISDALTHIHGVANQLEQYRDMMVAFERSRFETILPQPVAQPATNVVQDKGQFVRNMNELRDALDNIKQFDNFVDLINEGSDSNDETEEG